jgi:uncharacterized HAD superfamily protein
LVDYVQYLEKSRLKPSKNKKQGEPEDHLQYRDLWPINPEFRDVNPKYQAMRFGSLMVILGLMTFHLILLSFSLITIIELGIFSILLFLFAFRERIFSLQSLFSLRQFDPFGEFVFWRVEDDPHSVFYTRPAELLTVGLRIFRMEVIPENVTASMKHFVRAAASNFHSLNYQVIHQPISSSLLENGISKYQSHRTFIYFTITKKFTGFVTIQKLKRLIEFLRDESSALSSRFIADFHHYKITMLSEREATNALRTIFLHLPTAESEYDTEVKKSLSPFKVFTKVSVILFFSIFNGWLISITWNNSLLSMMISLSSCILLILVWWKEVLFRISSKRIFDSNAVIIVNPFGDLSFYRFKKAPDSIFFHSNEGITGGIHAFNVRHIPQPLFFDENKLYHPLVGTGSSFSTSISAMPISFNAFEKVGYKNLTRFTRNDLCWKVRTEEARIIWMVQRAGMWKAEMVFTAQAYRNEKELSSETLQDIELELHEGSQKLSSLFRIQYSGCELQALHTNHLKSAILMSVLKNRYSRLGGSHLRYSLIQGMDLYNFLDIDNAFKKGVETKIAAEFNTPLHLDNGLTLGHTINTEFLEKEVVAGFSLDQARQLLIMNGTSVSRERISLLLARNLIAQGQNVIYFDFTGNGSKLIKLLETESLRDNILHYNLGKTLAIDPIHSEIPRDTQNVRFLDLMLDAYALCFKKDEHTVVMFKNSLSQLSSSEDDEDFMGFHTLSLTLDTQQDWKKSPAVSSILSTLEDFTEQDSAYLYSQGKSSQNRSTVLDFLKNEKSVIIDISSSKDLEKKCFFTWLILAKFLHYQSQFEDCSPKYFIIPHIDIVFDQYFLEKDMKYGKIGKFITSLFQAGHGFICTASQAHFLHSNIFSLFQNYIAFKSTDTRDISTLRNVLNLEELHGQGYYSKSRNEAYQVRYLMTLRPHEALMKRDDIYQPFPVEFDFDPVRKIDPLSWKEIIDHMKNQGYDIEDAERKMFERAQKTVIEKDFGQYAFLIPEIINFLESLQTVHQIGNLYRSKIADELKNTIYPKLSKITKDKRQLKKMREDLLIILFSHGYLIESHPRQASGGQSIRPSFQVSSKFSTVLDDYYKTKQEVSTNVELEIVSQETDDIPDFIFSNESIRILPVAQVQPITRRTAIDILQWNLFQMHRSLTKQDYQQCLKIGKDLPEMFISNLQAEIEGLTDVKRFDTRDNFISSLCKVEGFPITEEEFKRWLEYPKTLISTEQITPDHIEDICKKIYDAHRDFSFQLESFISGGEG